MSWSTLGLNISVNVLAASGSNIVAACGSVFLSTNNGSNWTQINNGLNFNVTAVTISGTNFYAGTEDGGVFLSTNNG